MSVSLHLVTEPGRVGAADILATPAVLPRHGTESLTGVDVHDLAAHRAEFGLRRSHLGAAAASLLAAIEEVRLTGRG